MTTHVDRYADPLGDHDDPAPLLSRKEALAAGAAAGAAWLLALGHGVPTLASAADRTAAAPMTAARLVAIMRAERDQWNALLASVDARRMEVPGVVGTWSIKQLVAHLTWYERVIVDGAHQIMGTGTYVRRGLATLGLDERNARIAAESRTRPLQDVLTESERVFGQLLAVIRQCPDELLNDPQRLGLPTTVVPWTLVAANSYEHYGQHAQATRASLETTGVS